MVLNTWTDITCPSGCDDNLDFVALSPDQNCVTVPNLSQVSDLYITPNNATDAFDYSGGDPTLVSGGIDNTDTNNLFTKWIVGKGGVAEPAETTYPGPKGSVVVVKRRYTLEFEVNVKEDSTRNLLRQLQCNPKNFSFRYGTIGGQLYGGPDAIIPAASNARMVLGNGDEDYELGTIILEWETSAGSGDPPRHVNPQFSI